MGEQKLLPEQTRAALDYAKRGWPVFPVPIGTKKSHKSAEHSGGRKWGATTDPFEIRLDFERWPDANVGIACGLESGFFVIDVDTVAGHGINGIENFERLIAEHGPLPGTIEALSPTGSRHIYFKYPNGQDVRNSAGVVAPGVDVRGNGGMIIAPPSLRPGHKDPYRWINTPHEHELAECPPWLVGLASKKSAAPAETVRPAPQILQNEALQSTRKARQVLDSQIKYLLAAKDGSRNNALNSAAFNLGQIAADGILSIDLARTELCTAAISIGLEEAEVMATIDSGLTSGARKPRAPSALRTYEVILADAHSLEPNQADATERLVAEAVKLTPVKREVVLRAIKNATKIELSILRKQAQSHKDPVPDDLELARQVLEQVGRENVICVNQSIWLWQSLGIWKLRDERAVKQLVQQSFDAGGVDVRATRVTAVADVLKTEVYAPDHQFNLGNPDTVNCRNGELELQLGRWILLPHRREHYRTTQIPVEYDPRANAPMFLAFLADVFESDDDKEEKVKAVLELIGYTLMSHAQFEVFVMLIGAGANGKSVLLALIEALCGTENVAGVQPSKFTSPFQRAALDQKLANIVTEIRQGEIIADAELKSITSGEPTTVEHKFKDPFLLRPHATCWFGTNHMPHTRDFSDALFRRARILTFNRVYSIEEQDPNLKQKLIGELPGILRLSLNAYAHAVTNGFTEPASSQTAKEEWRLEADQVAMFCKDCCVADKEAETNFSILFLNYNKWVLENSIGRSMSAKGFRDRLTRLGYGNARDGRARYVTGIRLAATVDPPISAPPILRAPPAPPIPISGS